MKWIVSLLGTSLLAALPSSGVFAQQSAGAPATGQTVLVGSDSLVGSAVRDTGGRDIGKVSRLMIDPNDGRITSLILTTGGTLGMGSNTSAVSWIAIKVGQDRGKVIVTANQMLENAPAPADRSSSTSEPQPRRQ